MTNRKTGPKVKGAEDDETMPALYLHCLNTYRAMLSEATAKQDDAGNEIIVWEGFSTAFIQKKLNLSVPYYSGITKALKRMECIRQIKRGGGSAPSVWELITEPTEELYRNKMPKRVVQVDRVGMLQQQVSALSNRVGVLESALEHFIDQEVNKPAHLKGRP